MERSLGEIFILNGCKILVMGNAGGWKCKDCCFGGRYDTDSYKIGKDGKIAKTGCSITDKRYHCSRKAAALLNSTAGMCNSLARTDNESICFVLVSDIADIKND